MTGGRFEADLAAGRAAVASGERPSCWENTGWSVMTSIRPSPHTGCPSVDTQPTKRKSTNMEPPVMERPVEHMVSDYEAILTADWRMMKLYRDLLGDARHAIEHGRTAVVDEFLERTIDAMTIRMAAIEARPR